MKALFTISFLLVGCAGMGIDMPASVHKTESKADGTSMTYVQPGWVESKFWLGLQKSSEMKPNEVYFDVATEGETVQVKDGMVINVDGKKTTLSAVDDLSDLDNYRHFRKRFLGSLDLVKQMVNGKSVYIRLNHNGQTYSEAEFSKPVSYSAKSGFAEFLKSNGQH